jgi:hypothetical protein
MMLVWRLRWCDDGGGVSSWEVALDNHVSVERERGRGREREQVRRRHKTNAKLFLLFRIVYTSAMLLAAIYPSLSIRI